MSKAYELDPLNKTRADRNFEALRTLIMLQVIASTGIPESTLDGNSGYASKLDKSNIPGNKERDDD